MDSSIIKWRNIAQGIKMDARRHREPVVIRPVATRPSFAVFLGNEAHNEMQAFLMLEFFARRKRN